MVMKLPQQIIARAGTGEFHAGVAPGFNHFEIGAERGPIALLFAPPETAEFAYMTIAIGQVLQISSHSGANP